MRRIGKVFISFIFFITIGFKLDVYAGTIDSGQVVDSHKVWTIRFNENVKFDNFSKNYIKVINSSGISQDVELELGEDKKSIKVKSNSNGYNSGEKYTLKITKGLKSSKNKDLKKEASMDFYIKQEGSNELGESSPNNKENESLVVQDGEWIYYSDFTYKASIYKMKRDGSSKKLIYKGNDRICQLNASNGYIYFVSHTPDTPEEAYTLFRVKNDGSSKAEIICYNLSVYNQYQIYKNNIYYVYMSKLYKCDLDGKNPKELLNNIENKTDDVFFMIKDDFIYYWGFNYLTGKETGIYKMKIDGSEKQCIVKNTYAQSMQADTINVDNEYIYYKNFSGMVYKSDLKGNNIQKVTFLNKISAMNAFKGYIYYLYEGTIYKIKPDGTEQSIIAHQVDKEANYINIVNGYLWYFNFYDEIKCVDLNDESSSGLTSEGNISLKDGETFYIKGVNSPSSKIIKCISEDVNGDGKKENIVLAGNYENYVYKSLNLFVQNPSNGSIISYDALSNLNCEDVGNNITLGDFNKDKVKDIKIDLLTNIQRGIHSTHIYSLSNSKLNKIFDESMIPKLGQDFNCELLSNRNIKVSDNNNSYCLVDLSTDNYTHYNNLKSTGLSPSLTVWYDGEDSDKDGSLELSRTIYLVGVSYSDFLCKVKTTYKFNQSTARWEYKGFYVESEYYPCNQVGANKPDEGDTNQTGNNEQQVNNETGNNAGTNTEENINNQEDKAAVQSLVEKDGFVYYVEKQWTKSGSGYYLSDAPLYKVNKTSGKREIIAKNCLDTIQISGEWIYYISRLNGDLHKVKLDGTSDTNLYISGMKSFRILGDWIYYCESMYGTLGGIYKIKLDGTELTRLSLEPGEEIAVFEDWIYYINSRDWKIYRIKADGTSKECLEEIATHSLGVNKEGIYYSVRHSSSSSLHKMNHDGTNSKWIFNGVVGRYAIYGEYIYYVDATNKCIYKMKSDGSGAVKLRDTKANDIIGVSGDAIYYTAGETMDTEQIYTLKINHQ